MPTLVLLFIVLWAYLQWKWRRFVKVSKVLKHNMLSLPVLGLAYLFVGDGKAIMRGIDKLGKGALEQGGIMSGWLVHKHFIVIADPALASYVSKYCLEKHEVMRTCMKIVFGNALLVAPVAIWRPNRRNTLALFTSSSIQSYVPVFEEQANILVEKLRSTVGKPVSVFNIILRQSLDSLGQVSLDVSMDLQNAKEHIFLTGFEKMTEYVGSRFFKPWLHFDFIYELLPEFKDVTRIKAEAFKCIHERISSKINLLKRINSDDMQGTTTMKSFAEQYWTSDVDEAKIREEIIGLIMGGTDTTTICASFCVSMLARFPEVQERLHQEIVDHSHPGSGVDDMFNLKYLDAFIKETLRLYPPVPVVGREVTNDVTLPSGVVLPEGCGVLLHIWAINRSPQYWGPDAEEFRPERFLETSFKHPAQFMPFSIGPRNCIGYRFAIMSLKVTLSTLIRKLRVCPAVELKGRRTDFELSYGITMKDDDDFPVVFQLRD